MTNRAFRVIGAALVASCATPALASVPALSGDGAAPPQILVTGTRIPQAAAEPVEPTVSLDGAYLRERGLTNLADALNEQPGFRGGVTPAGVQENFGQGVNFANLFKLGSNRTLTLLNGRRVVSSNVPSLNGQADPGEQVDLNMIPAIMVERVDRVATGGAPVYGA